LSLVASPAIAEFDDGNSLLKMCHSEKGSFERGVCYGLVTGYFQGMQIAYTCSKVAPNIKRGQIIDVVVKFLQDNPAGRHLAGVLLSYLAFYVAFDCKEKTN
jgi:hypothetical protein